MPAPEGWKAEVRQSDHIDDLYYVMASCLPRNGRRGDFYYIHKDGHLSKFTNSDNSINHYPLQDREEPNSIYHHYDFEDLTTWPGWYRHREDAQEIADSFNRGNIPLPEEVE